MIALARTIMANPSIFILDEFTSGLDVLTEARLLEALDRMLAGRTRIVIAHRLGMVRRADHIVVMESGRVVEEGDHDSLMQQGGPYARLQGNHGACAWRARDLARRRRERLRFPQPRSPATTGGKEEPEWFLPCPRRIPTRPSSIST